jgi:hypothetical protein
LALVALVAVAKKVIDWSRGRIEEEGSFTAVAYGKSPSNLLLLLTDRRMLLMRALLSCSIQVRHVNDNMTSIGALTISTAKLFKDLLLRVESYKMDQGGSDYVYVCIFTYKSMCIYI